MFKGKNRKSLPIQREYIRKIKKRRYLGFIGLFINETVFLSKTANSIRKLVPERVFKTLGKVRIETFVIKNENSKYAEV